MSEHSQDFFTRLFLESRDALRRYVRQFVRSEDSADEIVQEAFLRTYEQSESVRVPHAFLFSTARNLAVDYRRRQRERVEDSLENVDTSDVTDGSAPQDDVLIADEASEILKQAIELLSPQCHATLTLRFFHGHSHKEIGAILGLSRKTVEKHLAKGMLRVSDYLRARYNGD